jgi:deoxyribonuclease-4
MMPLLGAHISIAGGLEKAPERGRRATCDVIQVFTKSNVQWAAGPISQEQQRLFSTNLEHFGIRMAFGHACYLVNLCSADTGVRRRSRRALAIELARCSFLNLPYLVFHPGSHGGKGEREAIRWIVGGITWALEKQPAVASGMSPMLLLETTAGQGQGVGWRFEHLAEMTTRLEATNRVGICFDTCHVFAAGYDLRSFEAYEQTMAEFDQVIGLHHIKVFHLNDSRGELGSRLDRHEHIGRGKIGLEGFRNPVNDPRFSDRPMIIETPKGKTPAMDVANLRRLRRLIVPACATE